MKKQNNKLIPVLMLVFAIIGLFSAIYLTHLHYKVESSDTICDINSTISCTNLAQSRYSTIGPIPIAVLGVIAYLTFIGLSLLMLFPKLALNLFTKLTVPNLTKSMLVLTSVGLLFTVYLIGVELVVKIFCLGCLVSWIATAALWILAFIQYHKL